MENYLREHRRAWTNPRGPEVGIMAVVSGWLAYADCHRDAYESEIGEDGILGEAWAQVGKQLRNLLNGDLGRLDGGTMDSILYDALTAQGSAPDTL